MLRIGKIEPSSSDQNRLAENLVFTKGALGCDHNCLVSHKDTWWRVSRANPPSLWSEPESLTLADQLDSMLGVAVDSLEPYPRTELAMCTEFAKSFIVNRLQLFNDVHKPGSIVQCP